MENIENIAQINYKGLEGALKELGIEIEKIEDGKVYIKVKKGVYLSRNEIKKRILVNEFLPKKQPLEPGKYGFETTNEGLLIIFRPNKELSKGSSFLFRIDSI